jgi:hypothetical protein
MRSVRRGLGGATLTLALAVGLTSCGGSGTNGLDKTSAAEAGRRAVAAFRSAPSVRVVGMVQSAGRENAASYDLVMSGTNTRGTIVRYNQRTEVVKVDGDTYIKGDQSFYRGIGEADAAELLAGRWVRLPADQAGEYRFFTIEGLALSLTEYVSAMRGSVVQTKLGEAKAVTVTSPDGSRLWASNTGAPYPLRLEMSGTDRGRIDFSGYGDKTSITRPPDPVDMSRLG